MGAFTGQLRSNEIFAALFNMIISQEVFADNIEGGYELVDKARVDGSLYGDQKLYYSTDVLSSEPWGADSEATNLLAIDRPDDPETQSIVLDIFRQIRVTVDNYLSKRAWADEGAFSSFNSVILGWIRDTKKVYDETLYDTFIGTEVSSANKGTYNIDLTTALTGLTGVEARQMEAMVIAEGLANLLTQLKRKTRDYNDYKFLRSYDLSKVKFIWNSKYVNRVKKVDLPTIFHSEKLVDKFEEDVLPEEYFGVVITSSNVSTYSDSTPAPGKPIDSDTDVYTPGSNNANGCIRSLIEIKLTVGGNNYHLFPGDEIPAGATIKASGDFEYGEVYIQTDDVICKVITKYPPFMSAFEVGTSFFNPRSLTENHYLTWGHNTLEHLKNYPFITVKNV